MAGVTLNVLNKRQRKVLFQQNSRYLADGRLTEAEVQPGAQGSFYIPYARCTRCDNLNIVPHGLKPIWDFNVHGSRPNGCSTHCTSCLKSNLTVEEAIVTKDLMDRHDVLPEDGELVLPLCFDDTVEPRWTKVSKLASPGKVLNRALERDLLNEEMELRLGKGEEEKAFLKISLLGVTLILVLVGLLLNISGGG